ncbi:MAG: hypothetical protein IJX17_03830 [Clostridia bacterium]|nr:hypothetical protein [Clostridia bacterium]
MIDTKNNITKNEMKKLHNNQFLIVREELNKVDPLGIIDNEKLVNEYDLENEYILTHLYKVKDEFELAEKIAEIFFNTCDIKSTSDKWLTCAKNILNKIKK